MGIEVAVILSSSPALVKKENNAEITTFLY